MSSKMISIEADLSKEEGFRYNALRYVGGAMDLPASKKFVFTRQRALAYIRRYAKHCPPLTDQDAVGCAIYIHAHNTLVNGQIMPSNDARTAAIKDALEDFMIAVPDVMAALGFAPLYIFSFESDLVAYICTHFAEWFRSTGILNRAGNTSPTERQKRLRNLWDTELIPFVPQRKRDAALKKAVWLLEGYREDLPFSKKDKSILDEARHELWLNPPSPASVLYKKSGGSLDFSPEAIRDALRKHKESLAPSRSVSLDEARGENKDHTIADEVTGSGFTPEDIVGDIHIAQIVREIQGWCQEKGPSYEAAYEYITSLENEADNKESRKTVASRHTVSEKEMRNAEPKVNEQIDRLRRRYSA